MRQNITKRDLEQIIRIADQVAKLKIKYQENDVELETNDGTIEASAFLDAALCELYQLWCAAHQKRENTEKSTATL